jgi:hypothetical protein
MRSSRGLASGLGLLVLALVGAAIPLDGAAHQLSASNTGFILVFTVIYAGVGLVLARRVPGNPIGWLFIAWALLILAGEAAGDYALLGYRYGHASLPLRPVAATIASIGSVLPIVILPFVIALFPDGRLSGRWARAIVLSAGLVAIFVVAEIVASVIAVGESPVRMLSDGQLAAVNHPSGPTAWLEAIEVVVLVPSVPIWIGVVVRQFRRYRLAAGLERVQLKWMLFGAVGSLAGVAYFASGVDSSGSSAIDVASTVAGALLGSLPVCMGIAILRYRLYDIDRLISRTLAYALLTGILVGAFIGVVALSTDVLPFSSRVGVAASTLVAAALFNPVRVRTQRVVDRRFNRARYDAQATVAAFSTQLREAVELDAVSEELLETVRRALEPSHVSVWIR